MIQAFHEPFVGGVPGGVDRSAEQHPVSRAKNGKRFPGKGGRKRILHRAPHRLPLARRVTWQLTFTATGRPATWVGSVSMLRPRAVVSPPKP